MRQHFVVILLAIFGLFARSAAAADYTGLFVFGDSLSDSGNNALAIGTAPSQVITGNTYVPTFPYASGRYTNGAVWAETFAGVLGLSAAPALAGGTNFAFGGAQTSFENPLTGGFPPSLQTQTHMFLGATGGFAPGDALYVVAGGGNNARAALESIAGGGDPMLTIGAAAINYASDIGAIVDLLQASGARDIVVWNTPNIGLAPAITALGPTASFLGGLLSTSMNGALNARLSGEDGVRTFDVFGVLNSIVANPAGYGLVNATDACGALASCNPSRYLFWDGIHPTSAGHDLLARGMVATVAPIPEPETYAMLLAGLALLGFIARRRVRQ